ncbi:Uncharacterised protein [Mycobacteroides abscessus]|nr:Uncharacterised protein [Mycobacteroides abscessus]
MLSPTSAWPPGRKRRRTAASMSSSLPKAWLAPMHSTTSKTPSSQVAASVSIQRTRSLSFRSSARRAAEAGSMWSIPTPAVPGCASSSSCSHSPSPHPRSTARAPSLGLSQPTSSRSRSGATGAPIGWRRWAMSKISERSTSATLQATACPRRRRRTSHHPGAHAALDTPTAPGPWGPGAVGWCRTSAREGRSGGGRHEQLSAS